MNRRVVLFSALAIIVALLFWYSSSLQSTFYTIADYLTELAHRNEPLAIAVFIITATFAALVSPLTNIPLVPIATIIWGPFLTTILLLTGWFIGDIMAYLVGRYLGHSVVSYFVSEEKLEEWSSVIKAHTTFSAALFLRLILPAELGYAFGIIRYHFGIFAVITLLAELPLAIVSTYASEAVIFGDMMRFFGFMAILLGIVYVAFRATRRKRGGGRTANDNNPL